MPQPIIGGQPRTIDLLQELNGEIQKRQKLYVCFECVNYSQHHFQSSK